MSDRPAASDRKPQRATASARGGATGPPPRLSARRVAAAAVLVALAAMARPAGVVEGAAAHDDGLQWWTTHGLAKVRPRDRARPSGPIELIAARNEFEPFQLVLRADARLQDVDVEVGDLVGPRGARIASDRATVYLEHYLDVRTPSSIEGEAGEWPDALLPRIDTYAGEKRRAFPFTVEPGRNQSIWIDLYVPPGTPPGDYRGETVVTVKGSERVEAPIALRVLPFELPSTSSFKATYGFSGLSALKQHRGGYSSDRDLYELTRVYTTALLRHRVSVHGMSMAPPEWTGSKKKVSFKWSRYDDEVAPFLDGTVFGPDDPLPGARMTTIDVRTPDIPDEDTKALYWAEWVSHFEQRGWLDRLFLYVFDEPGNEEQYAKVLGLGRIARRASPQLKVLLTEQLNPSLTEVVDIWVTLVNCVAPRGGIDYCEETVPRRAYERLEERGARVWWYQSCMSHGCNIVGDEAFTGWPSMVVDVDPVANRIMPWLAWIYGIDGELYYNTVEDYNNDGSPWDDLHAHGGNGDGTLFYPGTPKRIGGKTDIPIESIRLKLVREGMEDYEYLKLLERRGDDALAEREVKRFVRSAYEWDRSPEALLGARRVLADALAGARQSAVERGDGDGGHDGGGERGERGGDVRGAGAARAGAGAAQRGGR